MPHNEKINKEKHLTSFLKLKITTCFNRQPYGRIKASLRHYYLRSMVRYLLKVFQCERVFELINCFLFPIQVAQALFIVFNSFQGLFIFLLYCVRKPMIRKQWGLTCSDGTCHKRDTSRSESSGAGHTGSSSVITGMRSTHWR